MTTQVTLTDITRYQIRQAAERIFTIKQDCLKQETFINPRHSAWAEYRRQKQQASIWLTARRMLKGYDEQPPTARQTKAFVDGGGCFHARPGKKHAKALAREARRRLVKVQKQLENRPARFEKVGVWKVEREAAIHAAS